LQFKNKVGASGDNVDVATILEHYSIGSVLSVKIQTVDASSRKISLAFPPPKAEKRKVTHEDNQDVRSSKSSKRSKTE
jgi:ribosomal protein S1